MTKVLFTRYQGHVCVWNFMTSWTKNHMKRFIRPFSASLKSGWSYSHGVCSEPLRGITIGNLLEQKTEKTPEREAVVFCADRKRLTFSQLLEESDKLAAGLLSLGLRKGDRVGIWGPNSLEWILTQFAAARAGMILVTINPQYRCEELGYALGKVQCKALVAAKNFRDLDYYTVLEELLPELSTQSEGGVLTSKKLPELKYVIMMREDGFPGTLKFTDVLNAGSAEHRRNIRDIQSQLQFDDPISILFTSGTTGRPKGATLSHHNILNNCYFAGYNMGFHQRVTRVCSPVPLYHCSGMVLASLMIPNYGATVIFPAPYFDAGLTLKAVADEKCTALYSVPTMFTDMLHHQDLPHTDCSSLYTGIFGGAPCLRETVEQVIDKMNLTGVTVCYGTTENSPITFQTSRDDTFEQRVSTVGRTHPHVEAKIVDKDGRILPRGREGELCTRGYTTMLGYWNDPEKTAEVIGPDRWYKTGDLAIMDEEGYVQITGRLTDMIIRGGANIYPMEIEQILYTHPAVQAAQVVGVPDKRLGEQVCAWIQVKVNKTLTEEEVTLFCKQRMAANKVPRYIQFVTEFPLTVSGKVQKFKITEMATRHFGLDTS